MEAVWSSAINEPSTRQGSNTGSESSCCPAVCKPALPAGGLACWGHTPSPYETHLVNSTDVCNSLVHFIATTERMCVMVTIIPNNLFSAGRRELCVIRRMLCHIVPLLGHDLFPDSLHLIYRHWILSDRQVKLKMHSRYDLYVWGSCILMSPLMQRNRLLCDLCFKSLPRTDL